MMRRAMDFLLSTKTAIWLLCFLTLSFFSGAFIMPFEKAFLSIHSVPLLQWMREEPAGATWWLWGSALILFMLAVNTLFCSIDSLIKKRKVTQWMLLISSQIIHAGFLFMLLAHLLSSIGGFRVVGVAAEGTVLDMPDSSTLEIKRIQMSMDPGGYIIDWR
jgi:hypothetical protein